MTFLKKKRSSLSKVGFCGPFPVNSCPPGFGNCCFQKVEARQWSAMSSPSNRHVVVHEQSSLRWAATWPPPALGLTFHGETFPTAGGQCLTFSTLRILHRIGNFNSRKSSFLSTVLGCFKIALRKIRKIVLWLPSDVKITVHGIAMNQLTISSPSALELIMIQVKRTNSPSRQGRRLFHLKATPSWQQVRPGHGRHAMSLEPTLWFTCSNI